jgi:hypothetical protein
MFWAIFFFNLPQSERQFRGSFLHKDTMGAFAIFLPRIHQSTKITSSIYLPVKKHYKNTEHIAKTYFI